MSRNVSLVYPSAVVQHALCVRRRGAGAELMGNLDDLFRRKPADAADQRREVLAGHELHGKEHPAFGFADVEDAADSRVGDLPREANLVEDANTRILGARLNQLQRDGRFKDEIVGAPDVPHPASADPRNHPVAPGEHLAWRERHPSRLPRRGNGR